MGFMDRISGRAAIGLLAAAIAVAFVAGFVMRGGGPAAPTEPAPTAGTAAADTSAIIWTCSMHPQIRLPHPGKCPICFMDLIPLREEGAREEGDRRLEMTESAVKLAGIETIPVQRRAVSVRIRIVGEVEYDETRLADIASWVPGRIERLHVDFTGAPVKRGEKLAEIYSPQLVSAQEELLQAMSGDTSTLGSVREKLRLLGMTGEQVASIERGGKVRRTVATYAPVSGVVVEIGVREGEYVKTGTRMMRVADLSRVWVVLRAYQSDLPMLMRGQRVRFTATALPGSEFSGTVEFVDPVLDPETMTAGVRAAVRNEGGRLRPGMYVSGEILAPVAADGTVVPEGSAVEPEPLVIPATAPLLTGTRAVVYVRAPGDRPVFEGREVVLGPRAGDEYVVLDGLAEGELVVTAGEFKIDSELQIRAKPSMMSPAAGGTAGSRGDVEAGLTALDPLYDAYFDLQMALAGDDLDAAKSAFGHIGSAAGGAGLRLPAGPRREAWVELSGAIAESAARGSASADIEAARDVFYHLSRTMISLEEEVGHAGGDFWLTFCPMARDNAGAYWIQQVDTVYNSFFGKAMLRCGSIEEKLPPAGSGD
jgi:membrane fusion protein, copper/silver efflux system